MSNSNGITIVSLYLTRTGMNHFQSYLGSKQEWGHYNVPSIYDQWPNIGCWVSHHRSQYRMLKSGKKYLIINERIVKFEDFGFRWIYDSQLIHKMDWNKQFWELLEFKQEWGHCNVPKKYAQCPNLVNWVRYQRIP